MKKWVFTIILLIVLSISPTKSVSATFWSGDEAMGGWSYILDCAYKHKPLKEPYRTLMYKLYMQYHYEYEVTEEERAILERIVEAEATGGNVAQKMNVASCVLARVESKDWPNTIEKVVFQNDGKVWQFSPVSDKRYYSVKITDSTKRAVDKVLKNGKTHNCEWFCSDKSYHKENSWHRNHLKWAFFDGEHHYFY